MFLLSYCSWEVLSFNFDKSSSDKLTTYNVKIVFTSPVRVKRFFTFKDKLAKILLSEFFYKYKCGGCNATYY